MTSLWALGASAAEELAVELLGFQVRKAIDPLTPEGFLVIGDRISAALAKAARGAEAGVVEQTLEELDLDWDKVSVEAIDRAIHAANKAIGKHYDAMVLPKIDEVLEVEGPKMMKGTKSSIIARENIEIAASLSERDLVAEAAIRKSQVNFIRHSNGVRAGELAAKARELVSRGLSEGLGRDVIGRDLRKHFSDRIARPTGYWNVVASAFIGRARATSQIYGYEDGGVETFEVVAVLDEVTTDQCRFMDGRIFTVRSARALLDSLHELDNPEDVKFANPWIRKGKDSKGNQRLFIPHADGSTTTLAKVVRSDVGVRDQRGEFSGGKSTEAIAKLGVQFPPYHGECRTVIVAAAEASGEKPKPMVPGADLTPASDTEPAAQEQPEIKDVPPEHTPEHWEDHYKDFGEAAKTLAWGRAAQERGLAMSLKDSVAGLKKLRKQGVLVVSHNLPGAEMLRSLPPEGKNLKTVADGIAYYEGLAAENENTKPYYGAIADEMRMSAAMVAHVQALPKKRPKLKFPNVVLDTPTLSQAAKDEIAEVMEPVMKDTGTILSAVGAKTLSYPTKYTYEVATLKPGQRAHFSDIRKAIVLEDNEAQPGNHAKVLTTTLHETGHALEDANKRLLERSLAYVGKRTAGEELVKLKDLFPRSTYLDHELTRPDKLFHAYVGKDYGNRYTELTSMLIERLNNRSRMTQLVTDDPDSYLFLLGQLADQ